MLLLSMLLLAGCMAPPPGAGPTPTTPPDGGSRAFRVTSAAFEDGGAIPEEHTCDGDDASPPLAIEGAPIEAATLAILVYDPDAPIPQVPTRNITHWVLWNAPLREGSVSFEQGTIPGGAVEGASEGGDPGYMGPCPPQLSPAHRYVFTAFALDGPLDLAEGADRAAFESAIDGRVVDVVSITGLYARRVGPS